MLVNLLLIFLFSFLFQFLFLFKVIVLVFVVGGCCCWSQPWSWCRPKMPLMMLTMGIMGTLLVMAKVRASMKLRKKKHSTLVDISCFCLIFC